MRSTWKRALLACLVAGAIIPQTIVCDIPNVVLTPGYGYYEEYWYYDGGWGGWGDDCCDDDWGFDFGFDWW